MTLKADMLTDLDDVFFDTDEFAYSATYTPSGGEAATITYIEEETDPAIMEDIPPGDAKIIIIKASDVSSPERGDTVTIGSDTWYLVRNLGGGSAAGTWRLVLTRSERRRL
ncbi:MAG: hypothetical protein WC322_02325 [Candidatus Paceibacterota bacterium]|jgi:hypothetical protein